MTTAPLPDAFISALGCHSQGGRVAVLKDTLHAGAGFVVQALVRRYLQQGEKVGTGWHGTAYGRYIAKKLSNEACMHVCMYACACSSTPPIHTQQVLAPSIPFVTLFLLIRWYL